MCYKKIAANLISFIVKNWHYCPIDSNINVPNCQYWHSEHCKECLLKHAAHIRQFLMRKRKTTRRYPGVEEAEKQRCEIEEEPDWKAEVLVWLNMDQKGN